MAEVPVTITGVITDLEGNTISPGPVKLVGSMARSDVGIGGGPIMPPGGGGGQPPNLGLHPEHPIYYPPYPAHPIVLPPDPPTEPPTEPPTKPENPAWVWGYVPSMQAWQPVYVPSEGVSGPKS